MPIIVISYPIPTRERLEGKISERTQEIYAWGRYKSELYSVDMLNEKHIKAVDQIHLTFNKLYEGQVSGVLREK